MLLELPTDIFSEYILNYLDLTGLLNLSETNKYLYTLVNDEYIWRKLCFKDFNLAPYNTFRQTGWKKLYRLLLHPKVYVWGENFDARLGLDQDDNEIQQQQQTAPVNNMFRNIIRNPRGRPIYGQNRHGVEVALPEELRYLQNKSIVDIVSGGWSFHALDKYGFIWFWGAMQQDMTLHRSVGAKRITKPQKLKLPREDLRFSSVSSGRRHAIGLAKDGSAYHWSNCERIQKIELPSADLQVAQVTANWEHSSILTKCGQIFSVPRPDFILPSQVENEVAPTVLNELGVSFQSLLSTNKEQIFDAIPTREEGENDEFVHIAGILGHTIALTSYGRVLKLATEDLAAFSTNPTQHAIELAQFSATSMKDVGHSRHMMKRFVAGNHHSFGVCTGSGKVLLGNADAQKTTPPTIFEEFDGHNVCKISFGDYHCGAITTEGKLFTWGKCDSKALGHGFDVTELAKPKLVESLNDKFVFAVGFGGWQSSVLAIDLNE